MWGLGYMFNMENEWKNECINKPKLRTYVNFKYDYKTENYVKFNLSRGQRSLMAQFRSGTLPLRIEVGRYRGESPNERVCEFCSLNEIEDERHFVFRCTLYTQERLELFEDNKIDKNNNITLEQKLYLLFENHTFLFAKYIQKCYFKRNSEMYNNINACACSISE